MKAIYAVNYKSTNHSQIKLFSRIHLTDEWHSPSL